jgi:hypothetical protein
MLLVVTRTAQVFLGEAVRDVVENTQRLETHMPARWQTIQAPLPLASPEASRAKADLLRMHGL